MALSNGELSTHELLDAQTHVWNCVFKFMNSMSLRCAVDLGIPDIINKHGKPMTVAELMDALPNINKAKSQCIYRIMRLLTHSEFFIRVNISENEEKEGYLLTPASRLLLKDEPLSMTPLLQVVMDPILIEPLHYLSEWLCNDHHLTPFETAHGRTFWEQAEHVPKFSRLFNETMANDSELVNRVVLRSPRQVFEGFESFVDVGGNTGATAKAVAEAFPEMTCTVLDLPHVVAGLKGTNNLTFLGGDMFEAIPHADVVLLKWILHDWGDKDCTRILKRCKEAISSSRNKGKKVVIIDTILNHHGGGGDKAVEDQLLHDMSIMAYVGGKERTETELSKLFSDAGFSCYKIALDLGVRSLMEVYP